MNGDGHLDSFHAKDLILKNIVSAFSHDSLRWMGIEHTEVVGVMPTEFTTVEIRKDLSVSLISRDCHSRKWRSYRLNNQLRNLEATQFIITTGLAVLV